MKIRVNKEIKTHSKQGKLLSIAPHGLDTLYFILILTVDIMADISTDAGFCPTEFCIIPIYDL